MKYRRILPHVVFAIFVGGFVLLNNSSLNSSSKQSKVIQPSSTNNQRENTKQTAIVTRVVDGDTIEVSLNNKKETVRLIGIDAPETVDPRKPVQCFGKEASRKAKEVLTGKTITLESDLTQGNRDKYERLLRYVFVDDLNFNKLMISEGFAHEYTYQNNHYKYIKEFKDMERIAIEENKGLWSENACKIP